MSALKRKKRNCLDDSLRDYFIVIVDFALIM